jgi:hypothetical protein
MPPALRNPQPAPPRPAPAVFELARALARLAAAEDARPPTLPSEARP